jgi:cytochrome c-type biogenesis protein CcmH/NrfG
MRQGYRTFPADAATIAAMGFWRKHVIQPALSSETQRQMEEQREWIARDPANPRPYFHLAQFYRIEGRHDDALALLMEAVRLDDGFADAHIALAEIYAVRADYPAAWRHAKAAERSGNPRAVELLRRYTPLTEPRP